MICSHLQNIEEFKESKFASIGVNYWTIKSGPVAILTTGVLQVLGEVGFQEDQHKSHPLSSKRASSGCCLLCSLWSWNQRMAGFRAICLEGPIAGI